MFENVTKMEKVQMDSEESINSFKMKKRMGYLII